MPDGGLQCASALRPATGAEVKAEQERAKRRRAKKAATMRKLRAEGRAS